MWSKQDLVSACRDVGLRAGGVALVHSALRKLGPVDGGADTVLDALLELLGPAGTLALPTHTFKVVNAAQPVFHQDLTPANVGVLPNVFRQRPGVIRGLHPTHSVAALGPRAAALVHVRVEDDTPCPPQSPYGRLRDWDGQVLIIGEGLNCCTFFHGCEEWAGMPWAVVEKPVRLYVIDHGGRVTPFALRGHRLNTWDQYPRLEAPLIAAGALTVGRLGDCALRVLEARRAAEWLIPHLQQDAGLVLPDGERQPGK